MKKSNRAPYLSGNREAKFQIPKMCEAIEAGLKAVSVIFRGASADGPSVQGKSK